jgi:cellulose synthase/poly-beta-1,6-N-acetylglucosamine synthase-like glycosyltransferase
MQGKGMEHKSHTGIAGKEDAQKFAAYLTKHCILTDFEVKQALESADESGEHILRVMMNEGMANPYTLYQAWAKYQKIPFIDLLAEPCERTLLDAKEAERYVSLQLIPWKKEEGATFIAVCAITDEVQVWAKQRYGSAVRFVITSPVDIQQMVHRYFAPEGDEQAREALWQHQPYFSAKTLLNMAQFIGTVVLTFMLLGWIASDPLEALAGMFIAVNILYIAALAFKTLVFVLGGVHAARLALEEEPLQASDSELPIYTILVPLFKEEKVLPKLVKAIKKLDYPRAKLDVKLVVEEDDYQTIEAFKQLRAERIFELVQVPYSLPRTKPKALNYALRFARGKFVTIYDAEDKPDPQQLKRVLSYFKQADDNTVCVQARLNYFNREETMLTRLFAIEYSTLFDYILYGLKALHVPIPLGGTSNHFKIESLRELYAWDPYNVTEDADLGLRIAQKGWHIGLVASDTMEEAPLTLRSWIKQRSRWIKGHMQTYIVHMRHPVSLLRRVGLTGFMGFQLMLGAPAFVFLIAPIMWCLWVIFMTGYLSIEAYMPAWLPSVSMTGGSILLATVLLQWFYAWVAIRSRQWASMGRAGLLFPLYWVWHSVASFKALWQLITRPHYWEKTTHGETKFG